MSRFRFVVPSVLAIGIAGAACGQISKTDNSPANVIIPKMERAGIWQPTGGGVQIPIWPASTPLAKPDSGDPRESVTAQDLWEGAIGIGRATSPGRP